MINYINKYKIHLVCFAYLAISFLLIFFHEPWRDEAQQWLICRDLDLVGIIKQLKYEGHFLLWYLILLPFVKLGFPYITQNIISWLISGVGGVLFLKKAPFKFWKKALIIFTPMMLYYFPVITRCYCMLPLAICFVALSYEKRKEKPLNYLLSVVFLTNIHTFLLAPAGLLFLDYYIELIKSKEYKINFNKHLTNFCIIILLLVLSGLPLLGSIGINKSIGRNLSTAELFGEITISIPLNVTNYISSFISVPIFLPIVGMFLLELLLISFYPLNKKFCIYSILSLIYFSTLAGASLGVSAQKLSIVPSLLIMFWWIFKNEFNQNDTFKLSKNIILILLIINVLTGFYYYRFDILRKFSESKTIANYFNNKSDEHIIMLTGNQREIITSVIPYLRKDIKVYDIQFDKFNTYTTWDYHVQKETTSGDIINTKTKLEKDFHDNSFYYIFFPEKTRDLSDYQAIVDLAQNGDITLEIKFDDSYSYNEKYWVYKIN